MTIIYNPEFDKQIIEIVNYIAKDKPNVSIKFALELEKAILNLVNFPYKFRKSIYFNDDNVRDMIYKGYTIVYEINSSNNTIEILKIFSRNKPQKDITNHSSQ